MSSVKLIVGNWKMNGSFAANTALLSALTAVPAVKIVIAPPAVYLASSYAAINGSSPVELAAQNVAAEAQQGAYTGESLCTRCWQSLVLNMLIVGHSERRQYYGETDDVVAKNVCACKKQGLNPLFVWVKP
jgi:triosephosphate isomerase